MRFDIPAFKGMIPKVTPRLLPEENGEGAVMSRIDNGDLRPFNGNLDIQSAHNAGSLYLYREGGHEYWFTFAGNADVIESPIVDDPNNRVYMTGTANGARFTDSVLALSGGSVYPVATYQLGMPEPATPTTVLGADPDPGDTQGLDSEDRVYTITWVTETGEEGPPSLPSGNLTVKQSQPVNVTVPSGPGAVDLNITHFRVYRTTPAGTIQLCTNLSYNDGTQHDNQTDIPIGNTAIVDNTLTENLSDILPTVGWLAPPADMQGLISFPGGVAVAFKDKELLFSEPYHLYAWPVAYRLSVDYPIVAIATAGQSVYIATEGNPYVAYGSEPGVMSLQRLDVAQACVSKRSMVDMGNQVMYASPDGLVSITGGSAQLFTKSIINPRDWRTRFNPETLHAVYFDRQYYGWHSGTEGFIFNPENGDFVELDFYADCAFTDIENDALYVAVGNRIMQYDADTNTLNPYRWRSKLFITDEISISAAQIDAESYTDLRFKLFTDGVLVYDELVADDDTFNLPAGLGRRWQVEVSGTDVVNTIAMATNLAEL